ncbi:MAG: cyclopropane-fatty-acyl-phospholipid synthase family protein [Alphaproteobacteria bacterium]|nr:cyclopropane-fatty-acyl-phospholipid synthase family protein [Alphaproteobacteria bacterium]
MTSDSLETRRPVLERLLAAIGLRAWGVVAGHLVLTLPSGRKIEFGHASQGPAAELRLTSYRAIWASIRRGSLGLCEAYVDGHWQSPDPALVFSFCLANGKILDRATSFASLRRLIDRIWHLRRNNSRRGSKRNIEAHYDLGNTFYSLWLDGTMTYSSARYRDGAQSLEAAQAAKYQLVLEELGLQPGHTLLETGCGWGGLAEAAAGAGAAVTGITLSEEQLAYAKLRLNGRADLRLQDYRDVGGIFDRIASIEMVEAVGEAYWPEYFRMLRDRLKPGGVAVIQAITINPRLFPAYRRGVDFIQRHIFPGGLLPTTEILKSQAEAVGLVYQPVLSFGLDYARTLVVWRERFDSAWPQIVALGFDERFRRKWQLYLAYCEAGFRARTIDVGLYRFVKP